MSKELKIFLLAVGIPALILAGAGIRLVDIERRRVSCNPPPPEMRVRSDAEGRVKGRGKSSATERGKSAATERGKSAADERGKSAADERGKSAADERGKSAADERGKSDAEGRGKSDAEGRGKWRGKSDAESGGGRGRRRGQMARVFSQEERGDSVAAERVVWIGGCVIGLMFLSLVSGGWLLVKSARKAREDALMKTDFLSNISHEFKTPLTTICLCAELAQDDGLGAERRKKALKSIASEAERLKSLVLNALDFSRLEKNRREFCFTECDVVAVVNGAAEPLRERFAANGITLPEGAATRKTDVEALKQIVVILLDNAAKYAAAHGPVEVAVAEGGRVVTVADRGRGMNAEERRRAFERFWRGDNATTAETGGAGLGLAIARALAEGVGGDLTVAPREGGGLVFKLELGA